MGRSSLHGETMCRTTNTASTGNLQSNESSLKKPDGTVESADKITTQCSFGSIQVALRLLVMDGRAEPLPGDWEGLGPRQRIER